MQWCRNTEQTKLLFFFFFFLGGGGGGGVEPLITNNGCCPPPPPPPPKKKKKKNLSPQSIPVPLHPVLQWKLVMRSDITNRFLWSQLNNFLCFILFIDYWNNKQNFLVPRNFLYRVSPILSKVHVLYVHYVAIFVTMIFFEGQKCYSLLFSIFLLRARSLYIR